MTTFGGSSVEEALVNDVVSVLEAEDQNSAAEFIVKDVQLIRAEVFFSFYPGYILKIFAKLETEDIFA